MLSKSIEDTPLNRLLEEFDDTEQINDYLLEKGLNTQRAIADFFGVDQDGLKRMLDVLPEDIVPDFSAIEKRMKYTRYEEHFFAILIFVSQLISYFSILSAQRYFLKDTEISALIVVPMTILSTTVVWFSQFLAMRNGSANIVKKHEALWEELLKKARGTLSTFQRIEEILKMEKPKAETLNMLKIALGSNQPLEETSKICDRCMSPNHTNQTSCVSCGAPLS